MEISLLKSFVAFPLLEYFFVFAPPPPISFLMVRPLLAHSLLVTKKYRDVLLQKALIEERHENGPRF